MEGRFGETVRFGTQIALNRFVDLLVGEHKVASARDTYQRLGAGEYRQGRTLDALLAAYRVGARLAWRRFVDAGTQAGFPADALYDLGEAMFAYIDEISAESAAGFAEAQSEAAGESQRRRRRLLQLLVQEPAADAEAIRTAAQAAGWALPRLLAAVVAGEVDQPEGLAAARGEAGPSEELVDGIAAQLARRLGPGAVGAAVGGLAVVMMPDPDGPGRRKALEAALGGEVAALGPAVTWPEAAASLRRAEAAFRLAAQGRLLPRGTRARAATARRARPARSGRGARRRGATAGAAARRPVGRAGRGLPARPVFGLHGRPVPRAARRRRRAPPRAAARGRAGHRRRPRAHAPGAAGRPRRGAAGAARGHAARVVGPARAGAGDRRRRSTSTPRRSATGSSSCASCSGSAWRIRTPVSSSRSPFAPPTAFAIDVRHAPSRHGGRGHARHGCRRRRRRT